MPQQGNDVVMSKVLAWFYYILLLNSIVVTLTTNWVWVAKERHTWFDVTERNIK